MNKIAKIACVRNPFTGQRAQDFLFDIAALTGATVISEQRGMKLDQATKELAGKADKVIVTRDTTTIIGGEDNQVLQDRISSIQAQIDETVSEYEKKTLQDRLAMLTGGIGVIRVGTYTDTDFASKKLKFDNAINATQAALQEGIVAGGGVALAMVAEQSTDKIFKTALAVPLYQQAINAGVSHKQANKMVGVVQETGGAYGYDFKQKEVVNMFDSGIIDPFKLTRLALESAVAIASTLVTIETVIVNEK